MHYMIDIETAATSVDAHILSIGIAWGTGAADMQSRIWQIDPDAPQQRSISIETMRWWGKQSADAQRDAFDGDMTLNFALRDLYALINNAGVGPCPGMKVWAKPAMFDLPILDHAYRQAGYSGSPWSFRATRCLRTALHLSGKTKVKRTGTAHNAEDDARHQFKQLMICLGSA